MATVANIIFLYGPNNCTLNNFFILLLALFYSSREKKCFSIFMIKIGWNSFHINFFTKKRNKLFIIKTSEKLNRCCRALCSWKRFSKSSSSLYRWFHSQMCAVVLLHFLVPLENIFLRRLENGRENAMHGWIEWMASSYKNLKYLKLFACTCVCEIYWKRKSNQTCISKNWFIYCLVISSFHICLRKREKK